MTAYVRKIGKYVERENSRKGWTYLEKSGNVGESTLRKYSGNRGFVDEGYLLWVR